MPLTSILISTLLVAPGQHRQTPPYPLLVRWEETQTQSQIQKSPGGAIGVVYDAFSHSFIAHSSRFLMHTHVHMQIHPQSQAHTRLKVSFCATFTDTQIATSSYRFDYFSLLSVISLLLWKRSQYYFFTENGIMQNWLNLHHKVYVLL